MSLIQARFGEDTYPIGRFLLERTRALGISRSELVSRLGYRQIGKGHKALPSRPGEFHPEPLSDPDLTLSRHPARATERRLPPPVENWSSSCCQLAHSQRR